MSHYITPTAPGTVWYSSRSTSPGGMTGSSEWIFSIPEGWSTTWNAPGEEYYGLESGYKKSSVHDIAQTLSKAKKSHFTTLLLNESHYGHKRDIEDELGHQNRYKTELCRSWQESGSCRYGNKCQFAHGAEELRPVLRHPKYKTELCRSWVETGACPYGRRCRFIHQESVSLITHISHLSECGSLPISQNFNDLTSHSTTDIAQRESFSCPLGNISTQSSHWDNQNENSPNSNYIIEPKFEYNYNNSPQFDFSSQRDNLKSPENIASSSFSPTFSLPSSPQHGRFSLWHDDVIDDSSGDEDFGLMLPPLLASLNLCNDNMSENLKQGESKNSEKIEQKSSENIIHRKNSSGIKKSEFRKSEDNKKRGRLGRIFKC